MHSETQARCSDQLDRCAGRQGRAELHDRTVFSQVETLTSREVPVVLRQRFEEFRLDVGTANLWSTLHGTRQRSLQDFNCSAHSFCPFAPEGYLLFVGPDFYSTCYVLRRVTNLELPQVAVTLSCSGREQAKLSTTFITDPGIVPGQREPTDFAF